MSTLTNFISTTLGTVLVSGVALLFLVAVVWIVVRAILQHKELKRVSALETPEEHQAEAEFHLKKTTTSADPELVRYHHDKADAHFRMAELAESRGRKSSGRRAA